MPFGKVPVYCHMSRHGLRACGGAGWTLVMKTDGNKVSHDNQLFAVCRNMHVNIILIRIFKRIAKTSFAPSRVVRDIWRLSYKFLSVHSPPENHSNSAFFKYSKNVYVGYERDSRNSRIGQKRLFKANFRHIGGNGNGVTCFNLPIRFIHNFFYFCFYLANVSLHFQILEQQGRLQPSRRKDFV